MYSGLIWIMWTYCCWNADILLYQLVKHHWSRPLSGPPEKWPPWTPPQTSRASLWTSDCKVFVPLVEVQAGAQEVPGPFCVLKTGTCADCWLVLTSSNIPTPPLWVTEQNHNDVHYDDPVSSREGVMMFKILCLRKRRNAEFILESVSFNTI